MSCIANSTFSVPGKTRPWASLLAALALSISPAPARAIAGAERPSSARRPAAERLKGFERDVSELFAALEGSEKNPESQRAFPPVSILPIAEQSNAVFNEDPSRFPGIRGALEHPLGLPRLGLDLLDQARGIEEARPIQTACEIAGLECAERPPGKLPALEALWSELEIGEPVPNEWKSLPSAPKDSLRRILVALLAAVRVRKEVFAGYGPAELEAIRGPGLALSSPRRSQHGMRCDLRLFSG